MFVVDDEVYIADFLVIGLCFVGFDVCIVYNGIEALVVVAEFWLYLLVFDVMFFDIDGFELCC